MAIQFKEKITTESRHPRGNRGPDEGVRRSGELSETIQDVSSRP
jgi:hypothetical protein